MLTPASLINFSAGVSAPGAFGKISPAAGATGQATSLMLNWNASANATGYEYCLDTSNDGACAGWTSVATSR